MEKQNFLQNVEYRSADRSEWEACMDLAWRTFDKFEAPVYTAEGVENFKNFLNDGVLYNMFLNDAYKLYVAVYEGEIIGIISLRDSNHISLLFVDERFHKMGVGTGLFRHLATVMVRDMDECEVTVNAAPFAYGFYHKIGFTDTDAEQTREGITYTPMILVF